ncbi:MAG: GtrA family protein [Armatimonadetes bacterium]|nr:GtrA family protein [Armatimonadota bacterium]MDE2205815.1 GtrA family protein [Armatimonadota bacterium]
MIETKTSESDVTVHRRRSAGHRRSMVHQFLKFCVVGAFSTVIDFGVFYLLAQWVGLYWVIAQVISFSLAVTNGFIWNSVWTFNGIGSAPRHRQYLRFVAVNAVGLALNLALIKAGVAVLTGSWHQNGNPPRVPLLTAKAVAVIVVSVWNFAGSRKWTFR